MTDDLYKMRRKLTFKQAEGIEALPSQLKLKELSKEARAMLWSIVYFFLSSNIQNDGAYERTASIYGDWHQILRNMHVLYHHLPIDEFDDHPEGHIERLKKVIFYRDYDEVFEFLQFVMRDENCPEHFSTNIDNALKGGRAAYRVIGSDTIMPIASEAELETIKRAFVDIDHEELGGARSHLSKAGAELTKGNFADSIRESVHAVESVARKHDFFAH